MRGEDDRGMVSMDGGGLEWGGAGGVGQVQVTPVRWGKGWRKWSESAGTGWPHGAVPV